MKFGNLEVENPIDLIECIMAFDSRDWFKDKRDRMIYAVVFGISNEEVSQYKEVGYSDEMINEYRKAHDMLVRLKG